jgi:hypothetical protein
MRVFEIVAGTHKGKTIHVTKYVRTATGMKRHGKALKTMYPDWTYT